jgi:ABC-type nitrate/sulfonate/bicarbonate transport system permease component
MQAENEKRTSSTDSSNPDAGRASLTQMLESYPNIVRAVSVVTFLVFWEIAARDSNPLFMTYPSAILRASVDLFQSGALLRGLVDSLIPFSIGMVVSIVFGVLIGLAMGISRVVEYIIDPYVNALNAVPRIALVPLVILWFGLGIVAKVVIVISVAIFPIIINTFAGVRDVRGALLDIGRAYSATPSQTLWKIIIPASLPFIMTGIRLGLGLGIIGMIVAEFFTAVTGLGGIIVEYGNTFQTAKMFVAIVVVGLLGILMSEIAMAIERHWAKWRVSERERG